MSATKPPLSDLALTALAPAEPPVLRGLERAPLDRNAMLADVAAGKDVRLLMDIVAFRQADGVSNKNFVRFSPAALRKLGGSFAGMPFLRDHGQGELSARGGTILESSFHGERGQGEIRQTVELSAPWAVEAALRGLVSTFSIGWSRNAASEPLCTVCNAPMFSLDCNHFPGDVVKAKDGTEHVAEMLYTDVAGVETSAVNAPAVMNTGIERIRAALSAHRADLPPKEKSMPFPKLFALLSLAADSNEDAAVVAVERLQSLHAAEVAAHAGTKEKLAKIEAEATERRKVEDEATVERLLGVVRGKVGQKLGADDKPIRGGTPQERVLISTAKLSLKEAEAYATELAQVLPIGGPPISGQRVEPPTENGISASQRRVNQRLGVSDEAYLKAEAKKRTQAEQR